MWTQKSAVIKDELAAMKTALRLRKRKRQQRLDGAGLASRVKAYMLRTTAPMPEADEASIPEQEREIEQKVWNQATEEHRIESEEWFQEHCAEIRGKLGKQIIDITADSVQSAIGSTASWEAPGFDGVFGFFLKNVTVLHERIASEFSKILAAWRTRPLPEWFDRPFSFRRTGANMCLQPTTRDRSIACLASTNFSRRLRSESWRNIWTRSSLTSRRGAVQACTGRSTSC